MHLGSHATSDLFASVSDGERPPEGLTLVPGYLPPPHQAELLARIDALPWRTDLKRRVQHHGWRYDYRARRVAADDRIGPLPDWLGEEAERLVADGWFEKRPDQAIVNEYEPGQGIAAHIDCQPCFGEAIASLSIGSACMMEFRERGSGGRVSLALEPGSLLVLSGPARHSWTHAIPARKSDPIGGMQRSRQRRVSITFRTVTLGQHAPL